MNKNSKEFLNATDYVKKLNSTPTNNELLSLYGYYKQATCGNNKNKQPSLINFKGREKWNSWEKNKDMSVHNCEVEYIKLVNTLIKNYGVI